MDFYWETTAVIILSGINLTNKLKAAVHIGNYQGVLS